MDRYQRLLSSLGRSPLGCSVGRGQWLPNFPFPPFSYAVLLLLLLLYNKGVKRFTREVCAAEARKVDRDRPEMARLKVAITCGGEEAEVPSHAGRRLEKGCGGN